MRLEVSALKSGAARALPALASPITRDGQRLNTVEWPMAPTAPRKTAGIVEMAEDAHVSLETDGRRGARTWASIPAPSLSSRCDALQDHRAAIVSRTVAVVTTVFFPIARLS